MKFLAILALNLMGIAPVFGQVEKVLNSHDDFQSMTFEIKLMKEAYLPLESAFATFTFSNKADRTLTTVRPAFQTEAKLRIFDGEKITELSIPSTTGHTPRRLPAKFGAGDSYSKQIVLDIVREEFFPGPGTYNIQAVLLSEDRRQKLESNKVQITVVEPQGLDKEAFEFLSLHAESSSVFSWAYKGDTGQNLLEEFVRNYASTVYGDLAIYNLGVIYKSEGKLNEAEEQFEKIRNSSNALIASEAESFLSKMRKSEDPEF